jgi:hypothetical protein
MFSKLDAIKGLTTANKVLIENQPTLKNPAMKTVSCFLFAYFSMKFSNQPDRQINFISPSNKLKVNEEQIKKILPKVDGNDRIYKIVVKLTKKYLGLDYKNDKQDILLDPYIKKNQIRTDFVHLVLRYLMDKKGSQDTINQSNIFKSISITKEKFLEIIKKIEKDNDNYEITKLLAIKYTQILMEKRGTWLKHLDKYKKKDDLCDALLQGYYYLYK